MITLEENRTLGRHVATQAGRPRPASHPYRPASHPYKRSPPAPVFCRQAPPSFLSLCAQVLVPRTTIDVANLPKLDRSNSTHP
jgi:hypothetical protein